MKSLRNYDYITGLQNNILFKAFATFEVTIAEGDCHADMAFATKNSNVVHVRKRRHAAGQCQCLHNIDSGVNQEITGTVYLTDNVNFISADLLGGNRDHNVGNIALQLLGNIASDVINSFAGSFYFACQREREVAIRTDENFSLQIFFFPD